MDTANCFFIQTPSVPNRGECQVGYGGRYAVEWNGFSRNIQDSIGVMHIVVSAEPSVGAEWTNSLQICEKHNPESFLFWGDIPFSA
ncbi:hypothetical protein [Methanogenium cariaci]|jgi:hypothetical protein